MAGSAGWMEDLEWIRDGRHFHCLSKWMHALNCLTRVTEDPMYNRWAVNLAKTAHTRFTYQPWGGEPKHMYWKMSIDLSYPLVTSMGRHDRGILKRCVNKREAVYPLG
ncbi:MAG: hypothetical protein OEW33_07400 [Nitrospirota bacterium]|nr:hypothetical protein [Nitrospirota bacterium]